MFYGHFCAYGRLNGPKRHIPKDKPPEKSGFTMICLECDPVLGTLAKIFPVTQYWFYML